MFTVINWRRRTTWDANRSGALFRYRKENGGVLGCRCHSALQRSGYETIKVRAHGECCCGVSLDMPPIGECWRVSTLPEVSTLWEPIHRRPPSLTALLDLPCTPVPLVTDDDVNAALQSIRPTSDPKLAAAYDQWQRQHGSSISG